MKVFEDQQRWWASIADRASGDYFKQLMAPVLPPTIDVSAIVGPKMPLFSESVIASLHATEQILNTYAKQGIFESIAKQRQDVLDSVALAARSPSFAGIDAVKAFDLQRASIFEAAQQVATAMQATYLQNLTQSIRSVTSADILGIDRFSQSFLDYLRALPRVEWRAALELVERGWWLVPSWTSDFVLELMAERERRRCKISTLLTAHYRKQRCRELGRLVRGWDMPEFSEGRRSSLFKQALSQHRQRKFMAVIYSLAPQLEGILKDFLLAEGLCTPAEINRMGTVGLFTKHVSSTREPSMRGFATQLEAMYSHFTYEAPATGRRVRRHAQAHGREVPQNSEEQALRLWLMIETLHFHLARVRRARRAKTA